LLASLLMALAFFLRTPTLPGGTSAGHFY